MIRPLLCAFLLLIAGCSPEREEWTSRVGAVEPETGSPLARRALANLDGRTFANQPDRGQLLAYPSASGKIQGPSRQRNGLRDGAYTWHRASLSEAHAVRAIVDGKLRVNTPSGEQLTFQYERHVEHPSGDWTWFGRLDGGEPLDQIVLTFGERAAFGTIAQPDKQPLRLTVRNGVSWLVETNGAAVGLIDNSATRPRRPDYLLPPKTVRDAARRGPTTAALRSESAAVAGNVVVDVVLGYTDGFAAGLGGSSQAVTRLNNLVAITNQAYLNSQVTAEIRLVRTVQVTYPDATENNMALEELTGYRSGSGSIPVPAALQPIRDARNAYGADLVSLVRKFNEPENSNCGIAWLLGSDLGEIESSDERFGYSVVSDGVDSGDEGQTYFCRDETLAHELGHNMGSQHDRATATVDGELNYGVFPYSFGHKTGASLGNFYTVMAYGDSGQTRYRVFSNPRITSCGGFACGVESEADNARSLGQTIPIVATFRATVVPITTTLPPRNDVDGDGKSDLLLRNSGAGLTAYWIMNGAVPVRYSPAFAEPVDYTRVATGDFNGDGKLDLVWARSSDRSLLLWQGDGNGFFQFPIGNYSSGWQVVDAGDIDGDHKSDLLLRNSGTGQTAYWIMNGAAPTRYSPAFIEPAGYSRVASGDFNGDGRLDLVWARSSDRSLLLWQGDGNGFTQFAIGTHSDGWAVVDAGDIDRDGKSDLLLRNGGAGLTAYWIMNGAVPVRYSPAFAEPAGYVRVGTGDFNGDGKLDLLWARSSDRNLQLWQGDGNGFNALPIGTYSAGWTVGGSSSPPARYMRGDIDADGRSDLLLRNGGAGLAAYWIMNGAVPVRYSQAFNEPAGYARVATGDFNGDGRLDMVWARSSDRSLIMWQGDGNSFIQMVIGTYSHGWQVVDAGDVDGDGKSDLVLRNAGAGLTAYWIMSGPVPVRYSTTFAEPAGYVRVTSGDFNGDGKLDLVWARATDRSLVMWQGDGTGFVQSAIGAYSAGWAVIGAGDIDGDGKTDLLLANASQGLIAYWVMNGPVPLRYSGVFSQPANYSLAATGDYTGDAKLDLMWVRSSDRHVLMWQGDSIGFAAIAVRTYSEGWLVTAP